MNNFLPTTLALLAATTQVASAQDLGNGSLGSNGVEPLLELVPAATSKPLTFRVSRLNPPGASGAQLLLLIAARPAEIPLDGLGVRGAKLGLDLATLGIVGPFPVPASGVVLLRPTAAKAWNGLELHVQALYVDPRVTPPLTFSDSRSMTIGSATEIVLTRDATQAGTVDLERLLEDGRRGTSVPVLRGLAVRDLDIASLDEARRFRPDLPGLAVADGRRAVRLADGSTLLLYQRGSVNGLARIYRSGRIERVHESPAGTVLPVLAASKTHVAFIDGLRLMLYRTDGSNWSGTTHPLEDVTPTGAANLEMTALVFGRSVLAGMDKRRGLWFVSLSTGKSSFPKLPPSGGRNPFFFDEEIAVSGDGRSFAFGAGPGKKAKDIYVVRDDGRAVNVTKRVTDYQEVGYSNPGRRIEIALNNDGSRVSYVDDGGKEPENYVSTVKLPTRTHITSSTAFVDSIDIGTTSRMPVKGGALIIAGFNASSLDVFFSPGINDRDIIPLTNTARATKAPWGKNAKLSLLDLGSAVGRDQYLLHAFEQGRTFPELWVLDPFRKTSRRASTLFTGIGAPIAMTGRVIVEDSAGVVVVDPANASSGFAKRVALSAASRVAALHADALGQAAGVLSRSASGNDLWRVSLGTKPVATRLSKSSADYRGVRVVGTAVYTLSPSRGASGRGLLRWRPSTGLAAAGGDKLRSFVQN